MLKEVWWRWFYSILDEIYFMQDSFAVSIKCLKNVYILIDFLEIQVE